MSICDLLAKNLGKPNGKLCPVSTPFDEQLAIHANSYFMRRADQMYGCGLPGEPSCESIEREENFHKKKIYDLTRERNAYLEKIKDIPFSCFITLEELKDHFGISLLP